MATMLKEHTSNTAPAGGTLGQHRAHDLALRAGRFLWHFAQMVLAMEAGMMIYYRLILSLLAGTGFAMLVQRSMLFGYWMMVISMVLPMIALMRLYYRSAWPYCLGMTGAMLAPTAIITVLVLSSVCSVQILHAFGDTLMFLAMAVFLLCRPMHHVRIAGQAAVC